MREAILALMSIEGVGPGIYRNLTEAFGSIKTALEQKRSELLRVRGMNREIAEKISRGEYQSSLERQLTWLEKNKAEYITLADSNYPEVLRQIYDAPPLLMYRGKPDPEDNIAFAVVGTRYPDEYGKLMAQRIAEGIAERDICIISGMARGIDTAAHIAALNRGARSIAVLGTPLDRIYPAENRALYQKITAQGWICSEIPIGYPHVPANFIRRNRIISGLSRGVVVIQAGSKSGAIVTALNANEQNRDVFAVPGDCLRARHAGCHRLIRLGAKLVESAEDVLCEYPFLKDRLSGQKDCFAEAARRIQLGREEELVLQCLDREAVYIDKIYEYCKLNRSEVMKALLGLEIKGYVQRLKGDYYRREI
ncbi:MAG: DNA-processing protein DprA [Candidatus Neomarinimicrobiota bacterium]|jgi:DNA processing protein|nr:DNA-processing protein DprA [Candidatus Neomarinimicrobiota bacterium]MDD3966121.1 DNA-processing protein DprA [Candidatus Neomarinimicrobiota bacterium]MDX9779877.1 DNA-processing protein DprA [bacterium]